MRIRRLRDRWKRRQARRNPVILKCPACRSKLRRFLCGWAWAAHLIAWCVFCQQVIWNTGVGIALGWTVELILIWPFQAATRRLYEHYWHWRHPLRCEQGGHAEPLPEAS